MTGSSMYFFSLLTDVKFSYNMVKEVESSYESVEVFLHHFFFFNNLNFAENPLKQSVNLVENWCKLDVEVLYSPHLEAPWAPLKHKSFNMFKIFDSVSTIFDLAKLF